MKRKAEAEIIPMRRSGQNNDSADEPGSDRKVLYLRLSKLYEELKDLDEMIEGDLNNSSASKRVHE